MELNHELAEKLRTLKNVDEWNSFADLALEAIQKWRGQITKFNVDDSFEKLAKDRIRWTAMANGVELLFVEMNKLIEELEKKEKEEEKDDNRK